MTIVQFNLQDEEARTLIGLLQCANPVDGPLKRALDALTQGLQEATVDRWLCLASVWSAAPSGCKLDTVKLICQHMRLPLKKAVDKATELEKGIFAPPDLIRDLLSRFPGTFVVSPEAPGGALNLSDDDLLAY